MYHVNFTQAALKQLSKLDKFTQRVITSWLKKNIDGCEDPRIHGKVLNSNLKGKWRYRVGDYRIICQIQDDKLLVLALAIGHRKEIYL